MLTDSSFSTHRERQTVPTDGGVIASSEPMSEKLIDELLNVHLAEEDRKMLVSDCKIAPEVLVRSRCFSLQRDNVGHQFLLDNHFGGGKSLIDRGIVFPAHGWRGELLDYSILSEKSRLNEKRQRVFFVESDNASPRIGIYPGVRELAAGIFSDLFVWSPNPVYALIAASKGMAAYHVVDGDHEPMAARGGLCQHLHDFDAAWQTCEKVNTHVFLQTGQLAPRSKEFSAMRCIADVIRARGAEVIEIQLSSFHFDEEWQLNSFGLKPAPQHIARVHDLLDWISAHRYDHFSK